MGDHRAAGDVARPPPGADRGALVGAGGELAAESVGEAVEGADLVQVVGLDGAAGGQDGGQEDRGGATGDRVHVVDEAVERHRVQGAVGVGGEEVAQHQQDALGEHLAVERPALGGRAGGLPLLVGGGQVADRLDVGDDVVARQFPVEDELAGGGVVAGAELAGEALGPGRAGVQGGGEVLHDGVRVAGAQARDEFLDAGVVPADLCQGAGRPLVVLLLVGGQLGLSPGLSGLGRVPVLLEAGAGLLPVAVAAGAGAQAAGGHLVAGRVGHGHRGGQCAGGERFDAFGAEQGGGGEGGGPATVGEQAGQGGDAGVEFLGAAAGVGLALPAVGGLSLAVHAGHGALGGAGLPLLFPLLLQPGAVCGLRLALLLALCLGPDAE